jgi:hypothetical protein
MIPAPEGEAFVWLLRDLIAMPDFQMKDVMDFSTSYPIWQMLNIYEIKMFTCPRLLEKDWVR